MTIVIFGNDFTIHTSNAASNFVRNMARGFVEDGVDTYIINYAREYGSYQGVVAGVNYYIPLEQGERNSKFVVRQYFRLKRFINLFRFVSKNIKKTDKNILIIYAESFPILVIGYLLKIMFFDLSLHYAAEHPVRYKKRFLRKIFLKNCYPYCVYRMNDGLLSVSGQLANFFKSFQGSKKINYIFPPVTDPEHFSKQYPSPYNFDYVAYCGAISLEKDGLDILLKSFAIVKRTLPEIKLLLIGRSQSNHELTIIMDLINSLDIFNNIVFPGFLEYQDLPKYLSNARILALARPTNLQNETGFPSKLPEYLSTKKPVIITRVGDIPRYFTNCVNCFLAEPGKVEDFAEKLLLALQDETLATKVGLNGYELAKTIFNYKYQGSELINILKNYSR